MLKEILRGTIGAQRAQDTELLTGLGLGLGVRAPSCSAPSVPPVWVERSHSKP